MSTDEKSKTGILPSSFRDNSGYLFNRNGTLYRQVNKGFKEDYDRLIQSGLCKELQDSGRLIAHEETDGIEAMDDRAYKILKPEFLPFISYPYEWSFSQLKDAALLTLEIQRLALKSGMILKDASAFNIQFHGGRAILIDSLSFRIYRPGMLWEAYRQFCQHFLGPLCLMSYRDSRLLRLWTSFIDGMPLDLVAKALPWKSWFNPGIFLHIGVHSRLQNQQPAKEKSAAAAPEQSMSMDSLLGLIDSLESTIRQLKSPTPQGVWSNYGDIHNYTDEAARSKRDSVAEFLSSCDRRIVWDVGANKGEFSRLAADNGAELVVSMDLEHDCVEQNYLFLKQAKRTNILPLVMDLTVPTPAIGWNNKERDTLVERGPADTVLALALIHHLAIGNNVPLHAIAAFFARIAKNLIIELVPKTDSQVKLMLSSRQDIFSDYNRTGFENAFKQEFDIMRCEELAESGRLLYLMRRRG